MSVERVILHSDLDNFYASVECLENPALCGKPVAVCGDPESRRGVVVAKNQEAKKYGVKTGDTMWQAMKKCPDLVCVPPRHHLYREYSQRVFQIYCRYTDRVEPFGPDEAWLDVTGCNRLFGTGEEIADKIRADIRNEIGLTASIGVSFNKTCAKLASDLKKPDAVCSIPRANYREIVWPMSVGVLLFVGKKTRTTLERYHLQTVGDVAQADKSFLCSILGKAGERLYEYANGTEHDPVKRWDAQDEVKSIGNSTTYPHDIVKEEEIYRELYRLCDHVSERLRRKGLRGKTVCLSVKTAEFLTYERQCALREYTSAPETMMEALMQLYRESYSVGLKVRSLGVRVTHLQEDALAAQLSLFSEDEKNSKYEQLAQTADHIRDRFGDDAICRALLLP
ncbi:MAG: DNA polymerase IV [Ruminococcaceae bacterium]|nr:DNA polymerase IV [Oscillospiraceae bacterium]